MPKLIFISFLIMLISSEIFAQKKDSANIFVRTAASPKGNYIYLFSAEQMQGKDSMLADNTASFIIEKFEYAGEKTFQNPGKKITATGVTNAASLSDFFTSSEKVEMRKLFGVNDDAGLAGYFNTHRQSSQYPMLYNRIEIKQALGHVLLDKEVDSSKVYFYQITRIDKQGNAQYWGYSFAQAKSGNYLLNHFKPHLSDIFTTDSGAVITWKMPVDVNLMFTTTPPASPIENDKSSIIYRMPFSPLSTRARVFTSGGEPFKNTSTLSPSLNGTLDTITYTYAQPLLPDKQLTVYLQTVDEVYNPGINSDTAVAFTVNRKTVPLLKVIRVEDVVNGVQISWDKIDAKPYMEAIQIGRYNSQDKYDSIAILPVTDTVFTDYKVELGQTYRYEAKVTFAPYLKLIQEVPAQGSGRFTKFARPLPAVNLSVKNVNKLPVLSWDAPTDPSFFGTFIYRGTSAKELDLVAGPVTSNTFVDSAENVSGRNTYYYAVVNQNLRQDTSVFSEVVSILPDKRIITSAPSTVDFYFVNDTLRISWNDVRANDNAIEKFVVTRSSGKETEFRQVANGVTINNYLHDHDLKRGTDYNYKVAAISVGGDTSEFSEPYTYSVKALPIPQIDLFYVRSITEGVQISLPTVLNEGRSGYNIYRREAAADEFTKVGFIKEGDFTFLDKNVIDNIIYVYGISVLTNSNEEGARGKSISIRHAKN